MFGSGSAIIGTFDPLIRGDYSHILPAGVPLWAFAIFQTVFCATSATIVSGAMAERTKFSAYCIYSAAISLLIYPISGHWIWGGGWLSQMGFHDFAGSTAVHMVGGICALCMWCNRNNPYRIICNRCNNRGRAFLWRRLTLPWSSGGRCSFCSSICGGYYHDCIFSDQVYDWSSC